MNPGLLTQLSQFQCVTIEHSRGKARPTLPRSKDTLSTVEPVSGVEVSTTAKNAVQKILGARTGTAIATAVTRDASRIYTATLAEMPHDGAVVRQLVALAARHMAIAAYYAAKGEEAGLDTDKGVKWLQTSSSQRAERTLVTAYDLATRLALSVHRRGVSTSFDALVAATTEAEE